MSSSWVAFGGAAAALVVGFALGSWLRAPAPPEPPPSAAADAPAAEEAEVARLQRELDSERGRRGALELEIALLRRELTPAAPDPTARPEAPHAGPADAELPRPGPGPDGDGAADAAGEDAAKPAHADWFDASKLNAIGVDERHAEYLRDRFEALQMDELYLRDQAARERWLHRPRYTVALRNLRDEARAEIGDEDYDRMLYASGRHNRVLLSDVLLSSPAAIAGVKAGDVLVRYGDRPIYDVRDLLAETTSGRPGQIESIDIERNGELLRFYVERGPLGAKIQPMLRAPAAAP